MPDAIIVLDFGSQTTQLISRRLRDIGVFTHVLPGDTPPAEFEHLAALGAGGHEGVRVRGVVLSGSPASVYSPGSPKPDPALLTCGMPMLGICYGLQALNYALGGSVTAAPAREFGRARVRFSRDHLLFDDIPDLFSSWMSHGDAIALPAAGFEVIATTENGHIACLADDRRRMVGIQFHPEVSHCDHGVQILANFALKICGCDAGWTMEHFAETATATIRAHVGTRPVLNLISGGVDSSVLAALLLRALPAAQVHLMYVDTGLMRRDETEEVRRALVALGAQHLHIVMAEADFLAGLAGIADPEEKRRIIGDTFVTVQQREVERLGVADAFLAQGTLYTDMVESGHGVGTKGAVIKSHHNVRSPLIAEKRRLGLLIEPLAVLYKDEVRALGRRLGVPETIVARHPFPGPGLAVRILGAVTAEACDILRAADAIFLEELRSRSLYDQIWQAFCVLLPVRSVGVTGDDRGYGMVVALRAIVSRDGMTADVFPFAMDDLLAISARITNEVDQVGRVVYDVSSKPPATIEWE